MENLMDYKNEKIVPVILCGGKGTRLWPLSRSSLPKQFLPLGRNRDKTLLQKTVERIKPIDKVDNPILICNEENRFITAEQLREIGVTPDSIILEPLARGTAPAIAIAAFKAIEEGYDPYILVLSSDHEITDVSNFVESIKGGLIYAKKGKIVTFGIIPNKPSTAFGYIKSKEPLTNDFLKGSAISNFIEKPNLEKAKEFITKSNFSWNSGIFLFKSSVILQEINNYQPKIFEICKGAIKHKLIDLDFIRLKKEIYAKCSTISIDVAVMEKTKLGTVVPLNAGWKDLGCWHEVWDSSEKDEEGNFTNGNIILDECKNSFFQSENRLLVGIGINDLIIIDTPDAILVMNKMYSQRVKKIVKELNEKNFPEGFEHKKIYRPWGSYTCLIESLKWKVKKIEVNPKQSLSLQMHKYRSEHWIVLIGKATVFIDKKKFYIDKNQSTFIPVETKHKLSNEQNTPLVLIEVQSGDSVDEKDIIRFEDQYGRLSK